jgi:hypothetical protein
MSADAEDTKYGPIGADRWSADTEDTDDDTGTKYGDKIADGQWSIPGLDQRPRLSQHARERWRQRLPDGVPPLDEALEGAVPVHEDVVGAFQTGDNTEPRAVLLIRTHTEARTTDAIALVSDDDTPPTVATVFTVGSKYTRSLRAYCRARLDNYPERAEEEPDE